MPLRPSERRAAHQTGDGVFLGTRDTSDREREEFNDGTDGHERSGNFWQVFM